MAGLTQALQQSVLDSATLFPTSGATDHIGYSTNGTSESTAVIAARTPIGATGWAAATAATPSVKANNAALTSAAAVGAGTITHVAIFSALSGGTQKTDWQALGTSRTLAIGDQMTFAIGAIQVTLD
jgi:hypothetical protein